MSIPSKALRFSPNETLLMDGESIEDCPGEKKVWKKEGNVFKAYAVETGSSNGSSTEILSGLKVGDEIITEFIILQEESSEEQGNNNPFMPRRPNRQQRNGQGGQSGQSGQGGQNNQGQVRPGGGAR